jgi:hypothetical protein
MILIQVRDAFPFKKTKNSPLHQPWHQQIPSRQPVLHSCTFREPIIFLQSWSFYGFIDGTLFRTKKETTLSCVEGKDTVKLSGVAKKNASQKHAVGRS